MADMISNTSRLIQVEDPDEKKRSEIVLDMKGRDRTMAQYASDSGVDPSTLSKVVNQKYKKPLSVRTLSALFEKRSKECSETLDDLIQANGMKRADTFSKPGVLRDRTQGEEEIESIISMDMLNRKETIRLLHYPLMFLGGKETPNGLRGVSDFHIDIIKDQGTTTQHFILDTDTVESILSENRLSGSTDEKTIRNLVMIKVSERISRDFAANFLLDAWDRGFMKGCRQTYVFTDRKVCETFRDYLKDASFHGEMSTMLVDLATRKVVKEELLHRKSSEDGS